MTVLRLSTNAARHRRRSKLSQTLTVEAGIGCTVGCTRSTTGVQALHFASWRGSLAASCRACLRFSWRCPSWRKHLRCSHLLPNHRQIRRINRQILRAIHLHPDDASTAAIPSARKAAAQCSASRTAKGTASHESSASAEFASRFAAAAFASRATTSASTSAGHRRADCGRPRRERGGAGLWRHAVRALLATNEHARNTIRRIQRARS